MVVRCVYEDSIQSDARIVKGYCYSLSRIRELLLVQTSDVIAST